MVTIDDIGEMADKMDNLIQASSMPLPPQLHVDQMRNAMVEMSAQLKRYYVEITKENPWR